MQKAALQRKWRTIPGGLDLILAKAHPNGFWRCVLKETHGIHQPGAMNTFPTNLRPCTA